ncbi:RNA polymerase sigma factor RpoD, C-terminal domain/RNA polymerase sigma factor, sigma-70 family protein [Arthrobacter nitrophenolicus]|uniref:RNA polymerase sigma factor RpoD, C-terminal domain/RNA polymerase sigma factor, sigma-70 family protein n=1 Tax=Arthrobacter nitrophenolicus TaxID=683150 RepID=L8TNS6_9MICC|nr:RNA polymerase sigma factor RpoD, C-terminal domain/RNA polymerase sigma factor, sigma-70 family protein [Arthrobacter nitrophenolicus]
MTPSSTKKDPAAQDDVSPEDKQAATGAKRAATKASAGADGKREPKKRGPKPGAKAAAEAANKASAGDVDPDEAEDVEDLDDIILEGPEAVEEADADADADPAKAVAGSGKGFVYSDADDDDAPVQQVMSAGATADPVKDYLKQIGKVALLNAEQEVDLALRIEAGLFAEEKIAADDGSMDRSTSGNWNSSSMTASAPRTTCWRPTSASWCRWQSATPAAACSSWTSSRKATWA